MWLTHPNVSLIVINHCPKTTVFCQKFWQKPYLCVDVSRSLDCKSSSVPNSFDSFQPWRNVRSSRCDHLSYRDEFHALVFHVSGADNPGAEIAGYPKQNPFRIDSRCLQGFPVWTKGSSQIKHMEIILKFSFLFSKTYVALMGLKMGTANLVVPIPFWIRSNAQWGSASCMTLWADTAASRTCWALVAMTMRSGLLLVPSSDVMSVPADGIRTVRSPLAPSTRSPVPLKFFNILQ